MSHHFCTRDSFTKILDTTPETRAAIEDTIERLVSLLGALDPDPDFEVVECDEDDGNAVPCLGWASRLNGNIITGGDTDLEQEVDA